MKGGKETNNAMNNDCCNVCFQDVLDPGVPDPLLLVETHPVPASITQQEEVNYTSGEKKPTNCIKMTISALLPLCCH